MVTSSLSERRGAGPGRSKACWIMADPFIVSSTMVKMVVRTVALSSIGSTLLVCLSCLQTTAYYSSPFLSATSTKRYCLVQHIIVSVQLSAGARHQRCPTCCCCCPARRETSPGYGPVVCLWLSVLRRISGGPLPVRM